MRSSNNTWQTTWQIIAQPHLLGPPSSNFGDNMLVVSNGSIPLKIYYSEFLALLCFPLFMWSANLDFPLRFYLYHRRIQRGIPKTSLAVSVVRHFRHFGVAFELRVPWDSGPPTTNKGPRAKYHCRPLVKIQSIPNISMSVTVKFRIKSRHLLHSVNYT